MKYLRFAFISIVFLILAITAGSSHMVSNTPLVKSKSVEVKNEVVFQNENLPLHGDVWFAFAAIGAISTYLAFKRK